MGSRRLGLSQSTGFCYCTADGIHGYGYRPDVSPSKPYLLIISTLPDDGDRSANSPSLIITSVGGQDDKTRPSSLDSCSTHGAEYWASLIRQSYGALYSGGTLDTECLKAPRRRRAGRYDMESRETGSAGHDGIETAPLSHLELGVFCIQVTPNRTYQQVIKYERDIVLLRKAIQARQKAEEQARAEARHHTEWNQRVLRQGPWDGVKDPLPLTGAPALPMPVTISDEESLAAFFNHLSVGDSHDTLIPVLVASPRSLRSSPQKVLFGRLTFARVLVPPNISQLMISLESNNFIRHFLLGNNMIGPVGARLISDFVLAHPDRMETWYLAGNCIDLAGFERLVSAWTTSTSITNIWLKRNPLGPIASTALSESITKTLKLRTLDLDQTELGDGGVAHLFSLLANHHSPTSLRHIYLNAVGIGYSACKSLADYLSSPHCTLDFAPENLGIRYNYLGDDVVDSVKVLVSSCETLRMLELGTTGMTRSALESISEEVVKSETLVVFAPKSVYNKVSTRVKLSVNERIKENVRQP
ncbi:hypothetical protein HO173_008575 [Letharia columbiana]|uniref:RNI-like protein n=1 Tax=Letharia columbiana TaxID=112416 RepID=A0A8H6FRA2_9LECA|nr:uncharacterized protein HO173_008575 [Letharia columbiana]KAF6233284.1 hypothetical protein HO173_008575 [Letharia columbiana]